MNNRDNKLLELRLNKYGNVSDETSSDEYFQNSCLRPIINIQSELLIAFFINYAVKQKRVFFSLENDKKLSYIENVIQRDIKFRNALKGTIIGMFTVDEYQIYIQNSSSLNKRMMNIVIESLKNNLQLIVID
jgi:hypothetical protein